MYDIFMIIWEFYDNRLFAFIIVQEINSTIKRTDDLQMPTYGVPVHDKTEARTFSIWCSVAMHMCWITCDGNIWITRRKFRRDMRWIWICLDFYIPTIAVLEICNVSNIAIKK